MKKPFFLFDFDGTLVDSMNCIYRGVCNVFERSGLIPPTLEDYILNFHFPYLGFYQDRGVIVDERQIWNWYIQEAYPFKAKLFPDARDLLENLSKAGYEAVIISANSEKNILNSLKVVGFPELEVCSVHVSDKSDCIRSFIERSSLGHETPYIGDIVSDMSQARIAGVKPIAILRNQFFDLAEHFRKAGARECVRSLTELKVI
jgi:phosphoglycolate phosphatase-like HAD superfamily hydrolase